MQTQLDPMHDKSIAEAKILLGYMADHEGNFDAPIDALFAALLACVTLAYGVGMPVDTLLEGVRLAYEDIAESGDLKNAH